MNKQPFQSYWGTMGLMLFAALLILILIKFQAVLELLHVVFTALSPFILGFFVAYVLNILVKRYERILPSKNLAQREWSRIVAIIASILTVITLFGIIAFLALPQLIHSLGILIQVLPTLLKSLSYNLQQYQHLLLPDYQQAFKENITQALTSLNIKTLANALLKQLVMALQAIIHFLFNFLLALIFSIFILLNKERLERQCFRLSKAFLKESNHKRLASLAKICHTTLSNYIIGQALEATILGCLVTLGLFIFGISYPINIGCAVGLLSLIPLGAYLGGLMGVIMLLPMGMGQSFLFILLLIIIQQIESNFIYPRVVGSSIGLPGIWTFAAITFGGFLYGVLGMIISVPLTAILYKLLRREVKYRLQAKNNIKEHSSNNSQ